MKGMSHDRAVRNIRMLRILPIRGRGIMTFEEFIASVESGEIVGRGLLTASLEHRTALRIAFDAGQSEKERCVDCDAISAAWGRRILCEECGA